MRERARRKDIVRIFRFQGGCRRGFVSEIVFDIPKSFMVV